MLVLLGVVFQGSCKAETFINKVQNRSSCFLTLMAEAYIHYYIPLDSAPPSEGGGGGMSRLMPYINRWTDVWCCLPQPLTWVSVPAFQVSHTKVSTSDGQTCLCASRDLLTPTSKCPLCPSKRAIEVGCKRVQTEWGICVCKGLCAPSW